MQLSSLLFDRVFKSQTFRANGTFTPSTKLLSSGGFIDVLLVGGGGGGGGGGGSTAGGGGGEVARSYIQIPTVSNVVVGTGGALQSNGTPSYIYSQTAFGVISTSINGSTTTLPFSGGGTLSTGSLILIGSEIMQVTVGGTSPVTVTRGWLSTVASATSGSSIYVVYALAGAGGGGFSNTGGNSGGIISWTGGVSGGGAGGPAKVAVVSNSTGVIAYNGDPVYSESSTLTFTGTEYPGPPLNGYGGGGTGTGSVGITVSTGPNTGFGGNPGLAGSSGIIILNWLE